MVFRKGLIKRIHVSQVNIRANRKSRLCNLPVFTVQTSRGPFKAYQVDIQGPSKLVHGSPLKCGARVWIETQAKVVT